MLEYNRRRAVFVVMYKYIHNGKSTFAKINTYLPSALASIMGDMLEKLKAQSLSSGLLFVIR